MPTRDDHSTPTGQIADPVIPEDDRQDDEQRHRQPSNQSRQQLARLQLPSDLVQLPVDEFRVADDLDPLCRPRVLPWYEIPCVSDDGPSVAAGNLAPERAATSHYRQCGRRV